MNKYLICEDGNLLKNLPKLIKEIDSKTTVISREKSFLSKNKYIDEYIAIRYAPHKDFNSQFIADKKLISRIDGWIIWGNDEIVRRVASSTLPLQEKLRILPAKKKYGLQMLGSKAGLAKISNEIKLRSPETYIAKNNLELKKHSLNFKTPFIVKSDKFGGGEYVKKVSTAKEKKELEIPKAWFPVIIQEFVIGELVGIEVFFKNGKLVAWIYTSFADTLGEFGPSYSRIYESPRERGFELDLILLAKACGLDGMFNCTFILKNNKYYLIEADARPNTWHFLYSYFKIPILEIMTEKQQIPATPYEADLVNRKAKIINLDRSIPYAFSQKSYRLIFESILRITHSTQWLAGGRVKTLKILVLALTLLLVVWLPKGLLTRIKNLKRVKLINRRIFER